MTTRLDDLTHHTVPLAQGGKVLALDTGATIGPEAAAMLLTSAHPS